MDTTTERQIAVLEGQLTIFDALEQPEPDNNEAAGDKPK